MTELPISSSLPAQSKSSAKTSKVRPKRGHGSRTYANFRSALSAIRIYKRNSLLASSGVFSGTMVVIATDTVIRGTNALYTLHVYMQALAILLVSSNGVAFAAASFIMINVMRVAGIERAWEFGMRLLIGARRRDILYQLLCEALLLSVMGGVLGSACGLLIGFVLTFLLHLAWIVQPLSILVLTSAAVISGTIGGLYPALKVAQKDFWDDSKSHTGL